MFTGRRSRLLSFRGQFSDGSPPIGNDDSRCHTARSEDSSVGEDDDVPKRQRSFFVSDQQV